MGNRRGAPESSRRKLLGGGRKEEPSTHQYSAEEKKTLPTLTIETSGYEGESETKNLYPKSESVGKNL